MKQSTKDNFIYLGVAGTVAAALTFYIFYTDKTIGRTPSIPSALLWGILSTPGIVALILERFWKHRRRRARWILLIVTVSINVSVTVVAYSCGWNPPVFLWSTMTTLCVTVVFIVAQKLLADDV